MKNDGQGIFPAHFLLLENNIFAESVGYFCGKRRKFVKRFYKLVKNELKIMDKNDHKFKVKQKKTK